MIILIFEVSLLSHDFFNQGKGGELNFFERSCAGEEEVGCHSNTVDGIVSQKYPKIRNLSSCLITD